MSIAENYRKVEENIQQACREAGRSRDEVRLIAVTKFVDTDRIGEAADAGAKEVGENRPQELVSKLDFFQKRGLCPHMIGQLQTNKVKYVIGKVALIQSVDRPELAKEISRLAQKHGCSQDVLLEVNIGAEEQKGGVMPAALPGFLDMVSQLPGIRVKGLMCIPPNVGQEEARRYFAQMRTLFDRLVSDGWKEMDTLSMGMSGDYIAAILEGATMVRVGTAIFGPRQTA